MNDKAAQRYIAQVRRALTCGRSEQKRLLARLGALLDTFQQENPEAGYAELIAAFGEPAVCAAELLSTLDESEVEAAHRKHLWLYRIAVLGLAAMLMVLLCVWFAKSRRFIEVHDGDSVIVEGDWTLVINPVKPNANEKAAATMERSSEGAPSHRSEWLPTSIP